VPLSNEFDTELRKEIAKVMPCVHISNSLIADRALLAIRKYINECKENGITTVDDLLNQMKIKDGQPRD
jgi:hypothetical protein